MLAITPFRHPPVPTSPFGGLPVPSQPTDPPGQVEERDQAANCSSDEDLAAALAGQDSGTSGSEQDDGEAGRVGPHGYVSDGFLVADGSGEVSPIYGYPVFRTRKSV